MSDTLLVIDLAPLRSLSGDDTEFVKEILEMISIQSPQLLDKINEEYAREEYQAMSKTVHKYKSSLQILGNQSLISMVQEMEDLSSTGHTTPRLASLLDTFNSICDQLLDIIREELIMLSDA
ncbi:MAG: Hpt domain-containing protein [Bacteroidia bacterium]|nr:Hpt domain-containing protein [Bacteroidia bacterium]